MYLSENILASQIKFNTVISRYNLKLFNDSTIYFFIAGVTLEGSGGLTVQQLLETPGLIQSTVTISGGPPTVTSTSHQGTQLSPAITNTSISKWGVFFFFYCCFVLVCNLFYCLFL